MGHQPVRPQSLLETKQLKEIGYRIAQLRGERTQREYAEESGMAQQSISAWERGVQRPTTLMILRLINNEGVNPNWLFLGVGRKYL